eukprot:1458454-Prymnesium_polylepis.1
MGVSPPIGLTNHGGVEALGLLCARCGGLIIFACPEGSIRKARGKICVPRTDTGSPARVGRLGPPPTHMSVGVGVGGGS